MLASTHLHRSLCLGLLCLLAACEHSEGGVCQGNRDCEDGLVCDLGLDEARGVCRAPGDIDAGTDAGSLPDTPGPLEPDASPDAAAPGAAGTGGEAGASAVDAGGLVDGGSLDGGVPGDDGG
jgi:hypothetical protein